MPKDNKLYYAAQKRGNLEEVQRILDLGDVNINMEYYSGETPLYAASVMGNLPVVKLLLERGALINKADYNGYTPLYWASHFNKIPTVEYLLEHGANVNQANREGKTPLFAAATKGNKEVLKILLANGAKINGRTLPGYDSDSDSDSGSDGNYYDTDEEEEKWNEKEIERLNTEAANEILERWPTTMWLVMLEHLFVTHLVDAESKKDFFEFYGNTGKGGKRRKTIKKGMKSNKRKKTNKRR